MTGLRKPCFGYSNASGVMLDRMKAATVVTFDAGTGTWRDAADMMVEDFGNCDNLMVDSAIEACGQPIVQHGDAADAFRDLTGFVACLVAVRALMGASRAT